MPLAGSTATFPLLLQDAAGAALSYANKAAFTGAGWAITFYNSTGTALSPQPTWDLLVGTVATQPDIYQVQYVVPTGDFTAVVDVLGTNYAAPTAYRDFGDGASLSQIYAAALESSGVVVQDATTGQDINVYQGDSIVVDMSVTETALSFIGAASLADCDTIAAELKLAATNATSAPEVATFAESITSDTSGARTVRVSLDSFPSALNVSGPLGTTVAARIDLRLTKGTKTIIASTVNVTSQWAAAAGGP